MPASKWMMGLGTELQLRNLNLKQLKVVHLGCIMKPPSKVKTTSPKIHVVFQAKPNVLLKNLKACVIQVSGNKLIKLIFTPSKNTKSLTLDTAS